MCLVNRLFVGETMGGSHRSGPTQPIGNALGQSTEFLGQAENNCFELSVVSGQNLPFSRTLS